MADASVVVVSTAISADNPEIVAAREARYSEGSAAGNACGTGYRHGVAIVGTHGKTTTTAMISVFTAGRPDPTPFRQRRAGQSCRCVMRVSARSRYPIAEADESDASFLHLQPMVCVVTNIEPDHMDTYHGDFETPKHYLCDTTATYVLRPGCGISMDDAVIREIVKIKYRLLRIFMVFMEDADVRITDFEQARLWYFFTVCRENLPDLTVELNYAGPSPRPECHRGDLVVATEEGIPDEDIPPLWREFQGTAAPFWISSANSAEHAVNQKEAV